MTVQTRRKQKTGNVVCSRRPSGLKVHKKKIPSRDMWNTKVRVGLNINFWKGWHRAFSRLHLWIENLPKGKATNQKKKCVDGNQSGWPSGLRHQTQEITYPRKVIHKCVRGFEAHFCQRTFQMSWGLKFSWKFPHTKIRVGSNANPFRQTFWKVWR